MLNPGSWILLSGALLQYLDCRQLPALEKLEKCAAAGGDVGDSVANAELRHCRQRVAAARDGKCFRACNCLGYRARAVGELIVLEYPDRAVPHHGARPGDDRSEHRGRP